MKQHEASATWPSPQEEPTQPPSPRRKNDAVLITPKRSAEMQRVDSLKKDLKAMATLVEHGAFKGAA